MTSAMSSSMPSASADHLDAVTRRVNTVTREGEEVRVVVVRRTCPAAADEVWSAVTDPARVARWFLPLTGDLEVGGRFQLEGHAGGEVLDCVAPERLALTWENDGETSWVDVSLRPVADGTLVQLDHSAPLSTEQWTEFGPAAVGIGWELVLMGLVDHLGAPDAARVEVPPGLGEFTAASGQAWAEAAIADGDDPDGAQAAAQRCVAAYVGE